MSTIQPQAEEYHAAVLNTAHFEMQQDELELAFEQWLKQNLPQPIYTQFINKRESIERNKEAITAARKWETSRKAELVAAAEQAAAEQGICGRELHPHVNILETTEVVFTDKVYAAAWLCRQGRGEDVSLKVWKLDWFRDHASNNTLPESIELRKSALIRIDSVWD